MEIIASILSALSAAGGAVGGAMTVGRWLVVYLRARSRDQKAGKILQWLRALGAASEAEVRRLVDEWDPPFEVSPAVRTELVLLLTNLVRTSRLHSTQGTPLSSYLRCERLI